MGKFASRIGLLGLLAIGTAAGAQEADNAPRDPAGEVNTFIGTTNEGKNFPGAVLPYGMVAFSPEQVAMPGSKWPVLSNGYEWNATGMKGFSLTHMMGAGCAGSGGDIPFMPVTVNVDRSPELSVSQTAFTSGFSHADESASPGAYSVKMKNGVQVDLSATQRTGFARFTWPAGRFANLLIRPSASEVGSSDAHIEIDAATRTVKGWVTSGNFCGQSPEKRRSYYTLHFVAEFDQAFQVGGTWENEVLKAGATSASGGTSYGDYPAPPLGKGSGGWISFRGAKKPVDVRIGISYVDEAGARANLAAESPAGTTLEQVRKQARDIWNAQLGKIAIEGGTPDERTVFYTALYHSVIHPTIYSDVDGRYTGFDKQVHSVSKFQKAQYANFSGWDVYRSQVQLVTLLDPQVGSDFAQSLLNQADQNGGVWDRWTHITGATGVMNGDPSPPSVAAIHAFGGDKFDLKSAYASLLKAATVPTALDVKRGGQRNGYGQRPGLDQWLKLHYLPADAAVWGAAATTLEYAAADFGVGELARRVGDTANVRKFRERAGWWRNLYNPKASPKGGYIQLRNADGSWPDFEPGTGEGFVEGSAAQYLWMIPHDPVGLFEMMGGRETATARLDAYFKDEKGNWIITDPETKEGAGKEHPELGNEPSIGDPWLYNFLGQPWKTQAIVRTALNQIWTNSPGGISGNDDLGQMSSWYVFSALGMYPLYPGRGELILGSPLFRKAVVSRPGATITILGNGAGTNAPYVQSLTYNGKPWSKSWLPESFLAKGGTLGFELSDKPNTSWGAADKDLPPSFGPKSK
ncbi:glycoside hydrolase family 92 protein [Sphingomonas sp. R-74633]|uniref:GH92 family glycosyl hydrolase n=1 Tax=Sphingomonas sp. R-74633 TaxID=2751188 RepID=UPI0015D3D7B7|nr:GH92 family glycosyl hydrolase [Sphingomonas sp. R-74633]NYT40670.1 glycoside hydrolase family 92 protein [Sphingomonas sp. R-74633]